ncbi:MAG: His/Gly/Thr/Pro-type tRNA ligase C-terminal domain-containing protein, partial [Nitrososphaera sp.]
KTTMQDDTVTIRHRDTMEQVRVKISDLHQYLRKAVVHHNT